MNLDSSIYGVLTDVMEVQGTYSLKGQIHPKIEPEIAFILGAGIEEVRAGSSISEAQLLAACDFVLPAMEILDSRFLGFKYFSLPDVIADNASSSQYVLGEKVSAREFTVESLAEIQMEMFTNAKLVASAQSSAISGNPLTSLVELIQMLDHTRYPLIPGMLVLAGAATSAVQLEPGLTITLKTSCFSDLFLKIV